MRRGRSSGFGDRGEEVPALSAVSAHAPEPARAPEAPHELSAAAARAPAPSRRHDASRTTAVTATIIRPMLIASNLTKTYQSGGRPLTVLREISLEVEDGGFLAVVGPSGCGKTTLLGLMAGLDLPTSGTVALDGQDLTALSEDGRARLRGEKVGFVFQTFQLIPTLTAEENVQVPMELVPRRQVARAGGGSGPAEGRRAESHRDVVRRSRELLARVGLEGREHHYPTQLSGGEQQRVAIARAFANRPSILFADEPTGNLDADTGARIIALLDELNRESGATIVLATHDADLAARAKGTLRLRDGTVVGAAEPA
jgi:putative ABC transport system ATP-binding protein